MLKVQLFFKRLIDLLIGIVSLLILSPLFLVICAAIKLDDHGPVFFKQKRLGLNGRVFEMIKFRTMVMNAESIGDGLVIKNEEDPRITKVGRLLRKTSLDELPQLLNIVKGDMALIGPRPPVTYHPYDGYDNYPEDAKKRFSMRPGITGLAQVEARNSASWDDRIKIDVRYVEEYSLLLDIKIFFRTFFAMKYTEEYTKQDK